MASDYGNNFGFLRSDEAVRVAEGRFRVPAAVSWLLGIVVEPDTTAAPAARQELRVAADNAAPVTGYTGLLLQELEWLRGIYESEVGLLDTFGYGVAKPNNLAIITGGAGTKVWFRNTPAQTRADGRVIPIRTMFIPDGVTRGVQLGWNGTNSVWTVLAGTTGEDTTYSTGITNAWMQVTNYATFGDGSARVEAVLLG